MNLLELQGISARYGESHALFNLDFKLEVGETVAVIGANGAGKSTFLKCIMGMIHSVSSSKFDYKGKSLVGISPEERVKMGISLVPEGRRLFPSLSVEENLLVGACRNGPWNLSAIYDLFPILQSKRTQRSTQLSGGQQQMVAIGRSLMSNPEVLLCDELSLGLAPIVIREIYESLGKIVRSGLSVVIVEQDITMAKKMSQRLYCFQEGRVTLVSRSDEVQMAEIKKAYFGR
ncbi:MAG: ABC transporter ATP-binding protein [Gammaproteobacteria bacterium]|nr:ABC transporter ATP-binding protein [Gammaproteobacteria bacterium]